MPIAFKSKLSSSVANATFLDKTIDDLKKGKLGLYKVTSSETGAIQDVQVYINEIADASGVSGEGDASRKTYSSNNYVSNGDDRKAAIGKLDAQAKVNSDNISSLSSTVSSLSSRNDVPNNAFYFGDSSTDGSWRIINTGTDLEIQIRVSGVWEQRGIFSP
jgi:hypothetical protein